MTSTEQLVEAVTYADDNDMEWFDVFDSTSDALRTLKSAQRELPDEGQMVCLLSARNADGNMFESHTPESAYKIALQEMYQELQENT